MKTDRFFRIEVQSILQAPPLLVIESEVIALLALQKSPSKMFAIGRYSTDSPSHQRRLKISAAY
ncbi:hypothetical protein [Polaromonas sp. CG9_12]|nr:hypothetical protein [Polaromonas sp. CG9_12]